MSTTDADGSEAESEPEPTGKECEMGWPRGRKNSRSSPVEQQKRRKKYQEPEVYGPHGRGQDHWHKRVLRTAAHAKHAVS